MKNTRVFLLALLVIGFSMSPVFAQNGQFCSAASSAGTYSLNCSGWTAAGPNGTLVPIMEVGIATGDPDGNWTGSGVVNIGGLAVISDTKTGKATTKSDCTGNVTYNKGTPGEVNITFVVNGNEMYGLVTDKGTVMSCTLKLISKHF
jgi:hypothetical protein